MPQNATYCIFGLIGVPLELLTHAIHFLASSPSADVKLRFDLGLLFSRFVVKWLSDRPKISVLSSLGTHQDIIISTIMQNLTTIVCTCTAAAISVPGVRTKKKLQKS